MKKASSAQTRRLEGRVPLYLTLVSAAMMLAGAGGDLERAAEWKYKKYKKWSVSGDFKGR